MLRLGKKSAAIILAGISREPNSAGLLQSPANDFNPTGCAVPAAGTKMEEDMKNRLLTGIAALFLVGTAGAQSNADNATAPSYKPEVTGPQDSTGTAGESPTKSMLNKSEAKRSASQRDQAESSGTSTENGSREAARTGEDQGGDVKRPAARSGN